MRLQALMAPVTDTSLQIRVDPGAPGLPSLLSNYLRNLSTIHPPLMN